MEAGILRPLIQNLSVSRCIHVQTQVWRALFSSVQRMPPFSSVWRTSLTTLLLTRLILDYLGIGKYLWRWTSLSRPNSRIWRIGYYTATDRDVRGSYNRQGSKVHDSEDCSVVRVEPVPWKRTLRTGMAAGNDPCPPTPLGI